MKIIGIESRIQFGHRVLGFQTFELALHPLELILPPNLIQVEMPITIHTDLGDRNGTIELARETFISPGENLRSWEVEWQNFINQMRYGTRR